MIDDLITRAAEVFEVSRAELLSESRRRTVVWARQAVALVAYERGQRFGIGVIEIGEALGRDHTTISYALAKANERIRQVPGYADLISDLYQAV